MPRSRAFRDLHDLKDEAAARRVTWRREKFRSWTMCQFDFAGRTCARIAGWFIGRGDNQNHEGRRTAEIVYRQKTKSRFADLNAIASPEYACGLRRTYC